jgi:IS1 family transposase/transposase-like protein
MTKQHRPPLASLACVNDVCKHYAQAGQGNLRVRKTYGQDALRYLRCKSCGLEFSERRNTPLWNSKISEQKAVAVAEQLAEGTSFKGASRVVKVSPEAVRRLAGQLGQHSGRFHDAHVKDLSATALQADERWGFAGNKQRQLWEAEVIDPKSRLIVERAQGARDEALLRRLLEGAQGRLSYPQGVVLFSDGEPSYRTLFPEVFGVPYRPARSRQRGRFPKVRYRIARSQAHVQIVKQRLGKRLVNVTTRLAHGSRKRLERELRRLGYQKPNTSAIERRNATARRMDACSVRKTLAFARTPETRDARGSWGMAVYNWVREHRSLRCLLAQPQGRRTYERRSPAMAAGLTEHLWCIAELLRCPTYPAWGQR